MTQNIGLSTGACVDISILDVMPTLAAIGVTGVEISTPPRHFDVLKPTEVQALQSRLQQEQSFRVISIHAPFGGLLDLAEPNPHHRTAALGAIMSAAAAVKRLGGDLVVVHPSDLERQHHRVEARIADCIDSLLILSENCRGLGVRLAVESPLPHLIGGHPAEFAQILRSLDSSILVCLDTGHTALGRHWRRFVEVAGDRLVHIHAHDNHGHWDDHLPPGDGIIDWADIRKSLRDIAYTGWIMLELQCPPTDLQPYFRRAVENMQRLLDG